LLEKGNYRQLESNDVVAVRPHSVHFGGFAIGKVHSLPLEITNTSSSSIRVSILAPETPFFKITYDKKGLLAPGMSEEIQVDFSPTGWRYYYDTVKIFCGELAENLIVPIHAYPAVNDIKLPRVIDFGRVAIGTTKTKTVPLKCTIPISFEYEIEMLATHPNITVAPLKGVIPANGSVDVAVTFSPTRHSTAHAELRFNIAQFNFDPALISIVGSSPPGYLNEDIIQHAESEREVHRAQARQDSMNASVEKLKGHKHRGPIEAKPPVIKVEVAEHVIDGIRVPNTHLGQQATNYILTQTPGKVPLQHFAAFLKEQRTGSASANGSGEQADNKQVMECRFDLQYREIANYDKAKELKNGRAVGEDQLTDEEIQKIMDERRERQELNAERLRIADVERVEPTLLSAKVGVPIQFRPVQTPSWDESENDTFTVRLQVIDRFLRAGAKAMIRLRAERRLRKLQVSMRAAGIQTRASCMSWVQEENKAAALGIGSKPEASSEIKRTNASAATSASDAVAEILESVKIPLDFALPVCIPTSQSGLAAEDRQPVQVAPLGDFKELTRADFHPRKDFKVLDYPRFTVPPPAAYLRPKPERPWNLDELEDPPVEEELPDGGADAAQDAEEKP